MPSVSATIRPMEARLPPMSGVPIITVAVPSSPTASDTEVSPPFLVRDTALVPARAASPMLEIDAVQRRLSLVGEERREAIAR